MAQQGLPLLNGSFATRLRFSKMTDRYRVNVFAIVVVDVVVNALADLKLVLSIYQPF
jgi:hypothetical protein